MRKQIVGILALAACSGCGPSGGDIKSAVEAWLKETRPAYQYEVVEVSNVKKYGSAYEYDLTVKDKETGDVLVSHENSLLFRDGKIAVFKGERMKPFGFERMRATTKTIMDSAEYRGATVQKIDTSSYCTNNETGSENTFSCLDDVALVPAGQKDPRNVRITNIMSWDGQRWGTAKIEPKLTGVWWRNDERSLRFNENGDLDIENHGDGTSAQNLWKDGGNKTLLIQYPEQRGMSGTLLQPAGPVARCPYKLSALEFELVDCNYYRLIGKYHR